MSTKDEAAVLCYFRKLEGLTQRLRKRVKSQGMTIRKLKRKLQYRYGSDFDDSSSDELIDSETETETDGSDDHEEENHDVTLANKGHNTTSGNDNSPLQYSNYFSDLSLW